MSTFSQALYIFYTVLLASVAFLVSLHTIRTLQADSIRNLTRIILLSLLSVFMWLGVVYLTVYYLIVIL